MPDDLTVSDVREVRADDLEIVWFEENTIILVAPRKPFNDSSPVFVQIQERSRHARAEFVHDVVADGLHVAIKATMHNLS